MRVSSAELRAAVSVSAVLSGVMVEGAFEVTDLDEEEGEVEEVEEEEAARLFFELGYGNSIAHVYWRYEV